MSFFKNLAAQAKLRLERARLRFAWLDVTVRTFKRFGEDEGGTYAAALTYYTFFSIFPLLLFAAAVLGYVLAGDAELQNDLIDQGVRTVPMIRDALTPDGLETIRKNRDAIALTAGILALYTGSGVVIALEEALNKIHHIDVQATFIQKRLRSLKWLAILGGLAVASLAVSSVARFIDNIAVDALAYLAGVAMSVVAFASAFKFLPARQATWAQVLPGAVVGAIAFQALNVLGQIYLATGQSARNDTFGTMAGAAALLIASFIISRIVLLSAEVNAVLEERRLIRQAPGNS